MHKTICDASKNYDVIIKCLRKMNEMGKKMNTNCLF